jgi:hypothetical protein
MLHEERWSLRVRQEFVRKTFIHRYIEGSAFADGQRRQAKSGLEVEPVELVRARVSLSSGALALCQLHPSTHCSCPSPCPRGSWPGAQSSRGERIAGCELDESVDLARTEETQPEEVSSKCVVAVPIVNAKNEPMKSRGRASMRAQETKKHVEGLLAHVKIVGLDDAQIRLHVTARHRMPVGNAGGSLRERTDPALVLAVGCT